MKLPSQSYDVNVMLSVEETNAHVLDNASKFWAGQVENWPGHVWFYTEHIKDICFQVSAPEV